MTLSASHFLQFVHEIHGVKSQKQDYCGLNTSHFVLYLFCDYLTSVFWAWITRRRYMNSAVCLPSLLQVVLFPAGLTEKWVSVFVNLSSISPLSAISTKTDCNGATRAEANLPFCCLNAVLTTCERETGRKAGGGAILTYHSQNSLRLSVRDLK